MEKFKNFYKSFKNLIQNIYKLNKLFWNDLKKFIIWIYIIAIIDVIFAFIARGSQAIIINNLTDIANGKILDKNTIIILAIVLVLSLIIPGLINIISNFARTVTWRKVDQIVHMNYFQKKSSLDYNQIENPIIHTMLLKIQENLWRFRNYFYGQFDIFGYIFNIFTILITIIFIKPIISFIIIFFTIPELVSKLKLSRTIWTIENLHGPTKRKWGYLRGIFYQQNWLLDVKLSSNIGFILKKIDKIINPFLVEQYKADKNRAINLSFTTFISKIGIIIATFILIYSVLNKEIQIGTFVFLYGLIVSFQSNLSYFFGYAVSQYEDNLYVNDFFELLDMKNILLYKQNSIILPCNKTPKIEFKNVSFTYPETQNEILHKMNLTINPGEKIAIVGVNGAGKTTLTKLLIRIFDVSEGEILIDGNNIKDLNLESWWNSIGYMQQDAVGYMLKVKESIAIGNTKNPIDLKKVKKSAQMSQASEFIEKYKNGYDEQLGKIFDGESLSGGQGQRISLARIFYKEPQVYILDEPTSAMDAEAEAKIFDTLANLPKDKTVIFISHRFSTIRQADRICLIEDGKIAELGTHKELIKNNSTYKRLFEIQAKGYE